MEMKKTGELLRQLRKEKGMTQKQAAECLQISDRTVSKWERGAGMPDVSFWKKLSVLYGVEIDKILDGDLQKKERNAGNMNRISFFRCEHCGNICWSIGNGEVSCCGRKLLPLQAMDADETHSVKTEETDGEYYISFEHEMKKEHYISFAALVSWDRVTLVRLYPEQAAEVRMPGQRKGTLYFCCHEHGLFRKKI